MNWRVILSNKAAKQHERLPLSVKEMFGFLAKEIEFLGPVRGNWKNYGKLGPDLHHCHIKSGRPTFVACWRVNKNIRLVEVYYVGTHEKAPY